MTLQELRNQALQLPINDRWRLVESLLSSIQQETRVSNSSAQDVNSLTDLDPWTLSLVGVVELGLQDSKESYVDYLEKKYL